MPRNPAEEVYADTPLSQLLVAHKDMRIAIDQAEDDDRIEEISSTMLAIEVEISGRVPRSKQDAIGQLGLLIALFPDDQYSVLRQTLDSLIVWASALP
jgi:hypothetical protein